MGGVDIGLELALAVLLIATLLHAIRLQRALGGLRQDRAALHDAVTGFDTGTRQAEAGLARLRDVADALGQQVDRATGLRDDLAFLSERGETLADRLDVLVRAGRALSPAGQPGAAQPAPVLARAPDSSPHAPAPNKLRSNAERNLLVALQGRL